MPWAVKRAWVAQVCRAVDRVHVERLPAMARTSIACCAISAFPFFPARRPGPWDFGGGIPPPVPHFTTAILGIYEHVAPYDLVYN